MRRWMMVMTIVAAVLFGVFGGLFLAFHKSLGWVFVAFAVMLVLYNLISLVDIWYRARERNMTFREMWNWEDKK